MEKYKYRVDINGDWNTFDTLDDAFKHIKDEWIDKEGHLVGTTHCQIRLFCERNVITETAFQKGEDKK